MTFEIRKARLDDARAVAELLREANFKAELEDTQRCCSAGEFCVAEGYGGVIVALVMRTSMEFGGRPQFHLPVLVTRFAFRRRGIARSLLCMIIEEADARGASVYAYAKTDASAGLLKGAGFQLASSNRDNDGNWRYERPQL